jgi:hypothetical protein
VRAREAVRISLMRNTIHLVTTRDARRLKPLFQPLHERGYLRGSPWGKAMRNADLGELMKAGAEIMGEKPRTIADLRKQLATRFPDHDTEALAYGVRYMVPLVFTTPRGIWGAGGQVTLTTVEAWIGPTGPAIAPDELVERYLAAFGPASPADFRAWSGLAMREAFERLRPGLRTFRDEHGKELFDLPRAPRPDPDDTSVPVRFLPDYDNILLAHDDRTRIMATGQHLGLFSSNGVMKGSVLVDGFVRAGWRPVNGGLTIEPFVKSIPKAERPHIEEEAERLLDFLVPGGKHDVRFSPPKR